jgi:hypothetical protein
MFHIGVFRRPVRTAPGSTAALMKASQEIKDSWTFLRIIKNDIV